MWNDNSCQILYVKHTDILTYKGELCRGGGIDCIIGDYGPKAIHVALDMHVHRRSLARS